MSFSTKILKLFTPETAHWLGKKAMRWRLRAPGLFYSGAAPILFGRPFRNVLGLAAGFDKNGELVDQIEHYGFSFVEVGSITHLGGKGNPKPRLFRLPDGKLLNRMGLNGDPASVVARRLAKCKSTAYATNIAKTHNPDIMGEQAILDMCATYQILKDNNARGIYTVLNISCPNTREGRTFEDPSALYQLLRNIERIRDKHPILLKLSPSLYSDPERFGNIIRLAEDFNINGYVIANTTPFEHPIHGKGGLSGGCSTINLMLQMVRRNVDNKPIIACGGVNCGKDVALCIKLGATLVQAYNGFVSGPNEGPRFAHTVLNELEGLINFGLEI